MAKKNIGASDRSLKPRVNTTKTRTAAKRPRAGKSSAEQAETLIVHGTVSYPNATPGAHLTVAAFDRDVASADALGEVVTDAQGNFRIEYSAAKFRRSSREKGGADIYLTIYGPHRQSLFKTRTSLDAPPDLRLNLTLPRNPAVTRGVVTNANGATLPDLPVRAYAIGLRSEEPLGRSLTAGDGRYEISYFARGANDAVNVLVRVFAAGSNADGVALVQSSIIFNAPPVAQCNLTVSAAALPPPSLFENTAQRLLPALKDLNLERLAEDEQHQDLTFLAGSTGIDRALVARFVGAHRLPEELPPEFWFALLGTPFKDYRADRSFADQLMALGKSLFLIDAAVVRKSLMRALDRHEIRTAPQKQVDGWIDDFTRLAAKRAAGTKANPTFAGQALAHAGITGAKRQETFTRLLNGQQTLTPELNTALQQDGSFKPAEIADLRTSFQLADLTRGDFSIVKMLKDSFDVRQPEQIRALARQSEAEWIDLVTRSLAAGNIELPISQGDAQTSEMYGKALEGRFRDAYPTAAFAGGLGRALRNGGAHGLQNADALSRFLDHHDTFELLNTPVDDFLSGHVDPDFQELADDQDFQLQLKAAQRVFKLAPTFEATDALLADDVHSAQKAYRMGEGEFVRRYSDRTGFTEDSARIAWNRAANTYATVLTIVSDLKSLDSEGQFDAVKSNTDALSNFPNWNNLFKSGDLCECEYCRSTLGPAAYFTDLLAFLKDRKSVDAAHSAKDVLFARRADLGFLELSCQNALTPLPYIDVVCEVLEGAIDVPRAADGLRANDLLVALPAGQAVDIKSTVAAAIRASFADPANDGKERIDPGTALSFTQASPTDLTRWVLHGEKATYLLKKTPAGAIYAEVLPNSKVSAEELRAYPQYVNPKVYDKLRQAKYPLALPFDLFNEEVRAAFRKSNLQRWDLMRTLRGAAAPGNPTEGDIAAEYFGISTNANAAEPDEKDLILVADATIAGQQQIWGETVDWLAKVGNVRVFLLKTGLEYNDLLTLLDLKFINPAGDIQVRHLDDSCDTDKKLIAVLDATKLDRIHRFLRLWRKLPGWTMWELDLVIRLAALGNGSLDEPFLISLFYFSRLRNRLGDKTTVEQVCGLLGDLNTASNFTGLYEKRADALYQDVFLNRRLISPLDQTFVIDPATNDIAPGVDPITGQPAPHQIDDHQTVVLAALRIAESDLGFFRALTRPAGATYIDGDLTLANLSFLWRHAWLSKLLKFKAEDWTAILEICQQDVARFETAEAAWLFVERIDQLKATGFTADELNWLLTADTSAKAATKEADAVRFLTGLRKSLGDIQAQYDANSAQYAFLSNPTDVVALSASLTALLQKLDRDEADVGAFLKILRGAVLLTADVQGLAAGFTFPAAITANNNIPISYDEPNGVLRFTGVMTDAQRVLLLGAALPAAVTGNPSYVAAIGGLFEQSQSARDDYVVTQTTLPAALALPPNLPSLPIRYDAPSQALSFAGVLTTAERLALRALNAAGAQLAAIETLFNGPRLAIKFFEHVFTAPLTMLPATVDFKAQLPADLAAKISFNVEQALLDFSGFMSDAEKAALDALAANALPEEIAYHAAVASLRAQPLAIAPPDGRIWLTDSDLDVTQAANDTLAKRLATAISRALAYLSKTLAANALVQTASAQLGVTDALTRHVLTTYVVISTLPPPTKQTLQAQLSGNFAIDAATLDGWYWAIRVCNIWTKWKVTLTEVEKLDGLTAVAKLLDLATLPLDTAGAVASVETFLRTNRLLKVRDALPEADITLLEVLERLALEAANAGAHPAPAFAADVQLLNDAWSAADAGALRASLDLGYPDDYLLADSWERLLHAFDLLGKLNAGADTAMTLAAPSMSLVQAKTIKDLLRSKLGAETWLSLSEEIQDALRERKRDALSAYLLSQPKPADAPSGKWENTDDLFDYYLLDIEMCSCLLTSRLVQGSGSIQLFVQRCFMGLEPRVVAAADGPAGDSAWQWWSWMSRYRVWEANRKVFLWPENWIEPELKKDRSSFFKDMESELTQNEINPDTVQTAFSNYLEKLDGVGQLEIAGLFQEDDGDDALVHVFGRTAGAEPHTYFYRQYDYRQWTPWEKVDLDIQGDYLIPLVANKKLFLFWPIFTEVPDEPRNSTVKLPTAGQRLFAPAKTRKRMRLQMATSTFRQGKWTPKKVSKDFDESAPYATENLRNRFQFFPVEVDGRFFIQYDSHSVNAVAIQALLVAAKEEAASNLATATADVADATDANADAIVAARNAAMAFGPVAVYVAVAKQTADYIDIDDPLFHTRGNKVNAAQQAVNGAFAAQQQSAQFGNDAAFVENSNAYYNAANDTLDQCNIANNPNNNGDVRDAASKAAKTKAHAAMDAAGYLLDSAKSVRDSLGDDARNTARDLRNAMVRQTAAQAAVDALSTSKTTAPNAASFLQDASDDASNASLSGAFDISGCSGAPEKVDSIRTFIAAIQPESVAVGDGTDFLMWVETAQHDSTTDDFSLETHFSNQYVQTYPVLRETPGIFRMAPTWHLSYIDKLCRAEDGSYNKVGTFLPFFYADQQRTFLVQPSLLIPNQGYGSYADLETFLRSQNILDAISERNGYLLSQKYYFNNFYHPFVCDFTKLVNNPLRGIPALMSRETQLQTSSFRFYDDYSPTGAVAGGAPQESRAPLPIEQVDFTPNGAYSPYNWELFFHAPLFVANALSINQRFEEARDWYHFIFNPLGLESQTPGGSTTSKYWITKPFFQTTDAQYVQQRIDNIMFLLSKNRSAPGQPLTDLEAQVIDWRRNPFEPHRIANYRTVAYQKTVVMKYLDNLVSWGDNLFRQETMESINEATQLYMLAAELLGPRPKKMPPRAIPPVESFNELEGELDKFSNALVLVENLVPQATTSPTFTSSKSVGPGLTGERHPPLPMLYFCIPQNEKMLGYWDTVADRLYKIRHCMSIDGVVRELALFAPPIDPAALVKAVAGGADIGTALADLNAPLPLYRFSVLLQKANEICNDVKSLGSALSVALEKQDAEALGLLRQSQELMLLQAVQALRQAQIDEATENLTGAMRSREMAVIKQQYYDSRKFISEGETVALALSAVSTGIDAAIAVGYALSGGLKAVPQFIVGGAGFGGSPHATAETGGSTFGSIAEDAALTLSAISHALEKGASVAATVAGYERRQEEWDFQTNLASKEIEQIDRTVAAAELRQAIAQKEFDNHLLQIENSRATDAFMRTKYTNQELYQWQIGQISGVFFQSYRLAYDLAKRAERCFRFELGIADSSYINFGYWDSLKKGLLSGEKLQYDLRRLENAYLDQNRREYELTKHLSLALTDPLALIQLRETGRCFLRLPEEIFDLDYPGHYFRRIKSVSLTLPCVAGPYTTISCTLRLTKNRIRINTAEATGYARNADADDDRFIENNISVKAIAASNAQNDSGMFELSFRDERYLPFEGAGALSEWSLELFNDDADDFGKPLRQFDYQTITDAILHLKYTAREDAGPFKKRAIAHLRDHFSKADATPGVRSFDLQREFPSQWYRFLNPANAAAGNVFELEMSPTLFPFHDDGKMLKINSVALLARASAGPDYSVVVDPVNVAALAAMKLAVAAKYGGLYFSQRDVAAQQIEVDPDAVPAKWQLTMTHTGGGNLAVDGMLLVIGYRWEGA